MSLFNLNVIISLLVGSATHSWFNYKNRHFKTDADVIIILRRDILKLFILNKQFITDQKILVMWDKKVYEPIRFINWIIQRVTLKKFEFMYALPSFEQPTHIITAQGVAAEQFFKIRSYTVKSFYKKLAYKYNLTILREKNLLCCALA